MVGEVVVHGHTPGSPAQLEPPLHSSEGGEPGARRLGVDTGFRGHGHGGQRVAHVVLTTQAQSVFPEVGPLSTEPEGGDQPFGANVAGLPIGLALDRERLHAAKGAG